MKPTRIALIGCGIWGRKILRDLRTLGARVRVYDPDPAVASALAGAGGVDLLPGLPTTGADLDGLIVATPSTTHRAVLERLLPLGRPIFVEKPLTTNRADAGALREAAAGAGSGPVFLMHIWRYHPGIQLLAQLTRSGELGRPLGLRSTRANWTSPRRDTDAWWNLAPHDLTIARTVLGHWPEPVAATGEYHDGVCRGMVAHFGAAPWVIVEVSNRYARKVREVRLHCTEGIAVLADERVDYVSIFRGGAHSPAPPPEERRPFAGPPPLLAELTEFLNYLAGGPAPRSPLGEGLAVVDLLERTAALARAAAQTTES